MQSLQWPTYYQPRVKVEFSGAYNDTFYYSEQSGTEPVISKVIHEMEIWGGSAHCTLIDPNDTLGNVDMTGLMAKVYWGYYDNGYEVFSEWPSMVVLDDRPAIGGETSRTLYLVSVMRLFAKDTLTTDITDPVNQLHISSSSENTVNWKAILERILGGETQDYDSRAMDGFVTYDLNLMRGWQSWRLVEDGNASLGAPGGEGWGSYRIPETQVLYKKGTTRLEILQHLMGMAGAFVGLKEEQNLIFEGLKEGQYFSYESGFRLVLLRDASWSTWKWDGYDMILDWDSVVWADERGHIGGIEPWDYSLFTKNFIAPNEIVVKYTTTYAGITSSREYIETIEPSYTRYPVSVIVDIGDISYQEGMAETTAKGMATKIGSKSTSGTVAAPMHLGADIHDKLLVRTSRTSQSLAGYVGRWRREIAPGRYKILFTLGEPNPLVLLDMHDAGVYTDIPQNYFNRAGLGLIANEDLSGSGYTANG